MNAQCINREQHVIDTDAGNNCLKLPQITINSGVEKTTTTFKYRLKL